MADLFKGDDPAASALLRDWPVSVSIPDRLSYGFHVRGPSRWRKIITRWPLGQPELTTEVPLTYGGSCKQRDQVVFFKQNLAGQGFMTEPAAGTWTVGPRHRSGYWQS